MEGKSDEEIPRPFPLRTQSGGEAKALKSLPSETDLTRSRSRGEGPSRSLGLGGTQADLLPFLRLLPGLSLSLPTRRPPEKCDVLL